MYLVTLPIANSNYTQLVFCLTDPRPEGYVGPLECEVELDAPCLDDSSWQSPMSRRVVGKNPRDAKQYRLFETVAECEAAGYLLIGPMPVVAYRWCNELQTVTARDAD